MSKASVFRLYCHRCLCEREVEEAVFYVTASEKWKHVVAIETPGEQRTAIFCPMHLELYRQEAEAQKVLD